MPPTISVYMLLLARFKICFWTPLEGIQTEIYSLCPGEQSEPQDDHGRAPRKNCAASAAQGMDAPPSPLHAASSTRPVAAANNQLRDSGTGLGETEYRDRDNYLGKMKNSSVSAKIISVF